MSTQGSKRVASLQMTVRDGLKGSQEWNTARLRTGGYRGRAVGLTAGPVAVLVVPLQLTIHVVPFAAAVHPLQPGWGHLGAAQQHPARGWQLSTCPAQTVSQRKTQTLYLCQVFLKKTRTQTLGPRRSTGWSGQIGGPPSHRVSAKFPRPGAPLHTEHLVNRSILQRITRTLRIQVVFREIVQNHGAPGIQARSTRLPASYTADHPTLARKTAV